MIPELQNDTEYPCMILFSLLVFADHEKTGTSRYPDGYGTGVAFAVRYEDETKLTDISDAIFRRTGPVQVEGVITMSEVQYRPRRQLVVFISDETGTLVLRFLHFYPSQIKQLSSGKRIRVRGELRQGYNGAEMVHPAYRMVEESTPLPDALTPVYPSCEGISQNYLRKEIAICLKKLDLARYLA